MVAGGIVENHRLLLRLRLPSHEEIKREAVALLVNYDPRRFFFSLAFYSSPFFLSCLPAPTFRQFIYISSLYDARN